MTANELANLLEVDSWYKLITREEIATMLRQQQAEIEALKKNLDVALMIVNEPAKTLTDEEIMEIIDTWDFGQDISPKDHMFLLCKAILRKAQEK